MLTRYALSSIILLQAAIGAAAGNLPLGQLALNGQVDIVAPEQPLSTQSDGTALLVDEMSIFTYERGTSLSLVNGDSAVLGFGTAVQFDGDRDAPVVRLERGAMSAFLADGSTTKLQVRELLIEGTGETTVSAAVTDDNVATIQAVQGDLLIVDASSASTADVAEGTRVRLALAENGGFKVILTQDAPTFDSENSDSLINTQLPDDEVKQEDDDDAAGYLTEEAGTEELALFGIPLGVGAGTAAVIGGVIVVGTGAVIVANNDDSGGGGDGDTTSPNRVPVSQINEPEMEEPPVHEDPCTLPTLRGIFCDPLPERGGF